MNRQRTIIIAIAVFTVLTTASLLFALFSVNNRNGLNVASTSEDQHFAENDPVVNSQLAPASSRDVEGVLRLSAQRGNPKLTGSDGRAIYTVENYQDIDERYIGVKVRTLLYDPGYLIIDTAQTPDAAIVLGPNDYFTDEEVKGYPKSVDDYLIREIMESHL